MLRRTLRRLGSTNRYTDGSGRALESSEIPRDLFIPTISNRAYPVRGEHWQPVVAGSQSPHKGNVIISGGGVVGLTIAAQFALRGWHTTVVERTAPLWRHSRARKDQSTQHPQEGEGEREKEETSGDDSSRIKRTNTAAAAASSFSSLNTLSTLRPTATAEPSDAPQGSWGPFAQLQCALLTRRAADALETAGVHLSAIRKFGVPVSGVMDHPGAYNGWLTWGLTEHHPFAVKMLAMDLFSLRGYLEQHVMTLPNTNLQVFYEHVVEAVYPLRQQLVVKPWKSSAAERAYMEALAGLSMEMADGVNGDGDSASTGGRTFTFKEGSVKKNPKSTAAAARTAEVVAKAREQRRAPPKTTSLTLNPLKWEKKFAKDAVDYDLLISAEGVNSHLRDLLDVEGFAADVDFGVKWFSLRTRALSPSHVHRWLHRRSTSAVTTAASYHVRSPRQVPMCIAFPRITGDDEFAVMVYMPIGEIQAVTSDSEFLRLFLADVVKTDPEAELRSSPCAPPSYVQPAPTIFCENLYNSVGLPSAVLVGDAGHYSHPFWMQGLALGLEDGVNLLNQVDAYSRHFYDAVKQYSDERGVCGDALRELTDRCLYYERKKHHNPILRLRNTYQRAMNTLLPRGVNTMYEGSVNHVYSKSIEQMLNGRGYSSYDYAEKQQAKHRAFYHFGRVYT